MLNGRLAPLLAALSLAGLGISIYLTASHWGGQPIACAGVGSCDYVNSSDYAKIGDVPVSLLGAGLYGSLFAVAVRWYLAPDDELAPFVFWGLAVAGVVYAAYLTYVEVAVLHAICVWCVASAVILLAMLATSTVTLLQASSQFESS
jgi:uncharacterized membrane protein